MNKAYIGLGSNIEPEENLTRAVQRLAACGQLKKVSTVYRSAVVGAAEGPDFLNCVVELDTPLNPEKLKFEILPRVEFELGRRRSPDRNAPRTIDLDLLFCCAAACTEELNSALELPHPDIFRRSYVARALVEIAPDLRLHAGERAISETLEDVSEPALVPVADFSQRLQKEMLDEHG